MQKELTKNYNPFLNKLQAIVSIIWLLTSCTSLSNTPAMEVTSSNNNTLDNEKVEEIFINNKYIPLLDIVERIRVYDDEETNISFSGLYEIPKETKEIWMKELSPSLQRQTDFINSLYEKTLCLLKGDVNTNDYLYYLLQERYKYLMIRKKQIEDCSISATKEKKRVIPTSKVLNDFMMELISHNGRMLTPEEKIFNEKLVLIIVNRYELLQLLIRECFNQCSLNELSPQTIDLLRTSVKLHAILTGDCKVLGHPDEAGNIYAILENLLLFPAEAPTHQELPELMQSCRTTIKKVIEIKDESDPINGTRKKNLRDFTNFLLVDAFTRHLTNEKQTNPDLKRFFIDNKAKIDRIVLGIKKNLDVEIYEAHFVPKQQMIKLKNIGTPLNIAHIIHTEITDYEVGKWPYELPYPDFLKKPQEELLSKQPVSPDSTLQHEGKDNQEKKITSRGKGTLKNKKKRSKLDKTKQTDEHTDIIKGGKQEEKNQVEEPKELGITLNKKVELGPKELGITLQQALVQELNEEELQQALLELKSGLIPPTNLEETVEEKKQEIQEMLASNFSFLRDWVVPKGLRSFHSQMLTHQYPRRTLTNQYQDTVDRLFDSQKQCNVSYRAFKTLWKAGGGEIISNHGGSHRELIGPRQEKLFGIFAHSGNQTYGSGYVKYLQTAALYVGLRPSGWM